MKKIIKGIVTQQEEGDITLLPRNRKVFKLISIGIYMEQKRKGKSKTLIDQIDYEIMEILMENKELTITGLLNKIGLTHSNLITHMKRLRNIIERRRDKQTIYVSLNEGGEKLLNVIRITK